MIKRAQKLLSGFLMACLAFVGLGMLPAMHVGADSGVDVSIGVGDTILSITGQTSSGAFVTIRDDGTVVATTVADTAGTFMKVLGAQTAGIHNLSIFAKTPAGMVSDSSDVSVNVRDHETTDLFVFLPSTISLSGSDLQPGAQLAAAGETIPGGTVVFSIDQNIQLLATVDSSSKWHLQIPPNQLNAGNHSITGYVTDGNGRSSTPTAPRFFTILASVPIGVSTVDSADKALRPPLKPRITLPKDNQTAIKDEVTIVGLSDAYGQVEIWRNSRLMGSVFADKHGGWYLTIKLQPGTNEITSRACRDNTCSAFSDILHVRYNPLEAPPQTMRLLLEKYRFDTVLGRDIQLVVIMQRTPPLLLYEIDWGDGSLQTTASTDAITSFSHSFENVGKYTGTISARDEQGNKVEAKFSVNVEAASADTSTWTSIVPLVTAASAVLVLARPGLIIKVLRLSKYIVPRRGR